ncbi:MAG TPA: hypothetical protein ENH94_04070 [Phycisphaerales bacterium]|nr:hypothetical protein [Phycisphaerales bacterium]
MTSPTSNGNIPTIAVSASCLPEAWEKAVIAVWENGIDVKTQYDTPDDKPSRDATVMITIDDPFAEPRIHKNFPGGPEELESYRQEVVAGIHDHWIDPAAGKWTYTYHERLSAYCPTDDLRNPNSPKPFAPFDQIQYITNALADCYHTRRAQAITWMPSADPQTDDPPCLQRIWCRLAANDAGDLLLNMNTHWRSRDLYRAWFMNVYALTEMQKLIAEKIAEKIEKPVRVGRYVDISDSLHIYGASLENAELEVAKMKSSPFTDRAWETSNAAFQTMTEEAMQNLAKDPDWYAKPKG